MAKFEVVVHNPAKKDFSRLPHKKLRRAVLEKISSLADTPKPIGCRKIIGVARAGGKAPEVFRLRHGDYRIIYSVHENERAVRILRVLHRKDAYRG